MKMTVLGRPRFSPSGGRGSGKIRAKYEQDQQSKGQKMFIFQIVRGLVTIL